MTFQQMLNTLWHRKLTIIVSVIVCIGAALGYAKLATPSYQSSALIQINSPSNTGSATPSAFTLPDPLQELSSTAVQDAAATTLHDPDPSALAGQVSGIVDPTSGALTVTGTGATPEESQAVTTAYADAFVDQLQTLAQDQVDKYTVALDGISAKISALQAQEGSATSATSPLQVQIQGLEQSYASLQTDLSTVQVGMPYAQVQVKAEPGSPTGLGKSKLIVIGLLTGLLVGCGIAFVREQFDDSLRLDPDIESVIDGPLLGELPEDAEVKKGSVSIALVQSPQSSLSEAVRDLRTSLRVLLVGQQSPALVVTSPAPGDGKTFVTANLAASWALTGSRVIVVSADFRRPRLEEVFGLDVADRPGLSDLIKANWKQAEPADGAVDGASEQLDVHRSSATRRPRRGIRSSFDETAVSAHLLETGIDGLQLLPVGVHLDNPSELFDSPGMQPVLDQLHVLADVVLLDTPPVLSAPDTAILGSLTHGAVIVASEGRTDRSDLERTAHRLEVTGCRVIGLVMNHVRRASSDGYQAYTYAKR